MATLTTSWQMLAQTYLGTSYGDLYVRLYGYYSQQDIANNRSYVVFQARAYFSGNYFKVNQGSGCVGGISGAVSGSCTYPTKGETNIATTEGWVSHAADGTCGVHGTAYLNFPNWGWSGTADAWATLPSIPRQATLTSAPDFNDEGNPTIYYSNPAGNAVTALRACISWTGGADIPYRDISKTGTSYTFNLTYAERIALRKATSTSNSRNVTFFVTTIIGSNTYYSTIVKKFTVVNCNPVLSPTVFDIGSHSTTLTGDNTKLIKGYSIAEATTGATAVKEASLTKQTVSCGNQNIQSPSAKFDPVNSGTFTFTATDSRGNTTSQTIVRDLIDYIKLTCNMSNDHPSVDGDFQFTITGNYFDGSFGVVTNSLKVECRFKIAGSDEWIGWIGEGVSSEIGINMSIGDPIIADGKYSITVNMTGLDYQTAYVIQARAADEVYAGYIETAERVVRALPTFDWSEKDFNFNVPVFKEGNPMGYYPIGGIYTSSDNTDPGELFGGTWELERRFYGGELLAYGTAWNSGSSSLVCYNTVYYSISDVLGGIYSSHLCNHMPDILTDDSGTIYVNTKGVVGLVEATMKISGQLDSSTYGIWFRRDNKNELPPSVILTGGGVLLSAEGTYSGACDTYFYNVSDSDEGTGFYVNPIWQPYGGTFYPCRAGIDSVLQVKAYAKGKVTYMWKRVA